MHTKATTQRLSYLTLMQAPAHTMEGSVILSLACNVTACPWPALVGKLMLMLALRDLNGSNSAFARSSKQPGVLSRVAIHFICFLPTWRMAERERPKFRVRHREWDNMIAVWQQPASGSETLISLLPYRKLWQASENRHAQEPRK